MSAVTTTNAPVTDPEGVAPPQSNLRGVYMAFERVLERLHRTAHLLDSAGIPYAVIGGHAVAAWVSTVNPEATRMTKDVDVMIRRSDLPLVQDAMAVGGFRFRHARGIDFFLDGPDGEFSSGVHLLFAEERVRKTDLAPTPSIDTRVRLDNVSFVALEGLVQLKLTAFRDHDRTHLRDLIRVGLINESWTARFPQHLAEKLQQVLDTPQG